MQKRAIITGPPPTVEEVAQRLGMSEKEVAKARKWAESLPPSKTLKAYRESIAKGAAKQRSAKSNESQ